MFDFFECGGADRESVSLSEELLLGQGLEAL
jgi:hypothetical protein